MQRTASLSSKMNRQDGKSSPECRTGSGQPYQLTHDQHYEQENDACHLGAEGSPWHQNVPKFLIQIILL